MRYHWEMGIGHTYTWRDASSPDQTTVNLNDAVADQHFYTNSSEPGGALALDLGRRHTVEDDPVPGLIDRENQVTNSDNSDDEVVSFDSESESESSALVEEREESDDETYIEMTRMYG